MRAPPSIRQLPDEVANKIAAGEVIERPAAVAKELIENSVDAGATAIAIRCDDGGRRLVEVEDNGHGMRPDDLRLALARHATSKLATAEDLFRVATLGFRGEALPSIASVSEFEIASRPHDAADGSLLKLANGIEAGFQRCAMAHGTRVSVRNLFWNVPVRLKFLKSEAAESGHVHEQVIRLALAHPRLAFRLTNDGRAILDLANNETLELRVRALFGKNLAASLLPVVAHSEGMQLSGFIAHPREAKPSAKRQYCFLNGRPVRDRLLIAAIREGFKGFLEPRLHGAVFLHLDIDPALVDVNVHPTKAEMRFRREGEVFTLISRAINGVLQKNSGGFSLLAAGDGAQARFAAAPEPLPDSVQERFLPATPAVMPAAERVSEAREDYGTRHLPGIRRVVQLNDMYLLVETDEGIRLLDQHAVHEKALFLCLDPVANKLAAGGQQRLFIATNVELSAAETAAVEPLLPELAKHGIEAEPFGPTSIMVRAYPAALKRVNWQNFFGDLAASGSHAKALAGLHERIAHSAACHGAIKAGQRLSNDEMLELVRLLYRLEHMEHCPHGRPTTLDLTWKELERRFQR